MDPWQEDVEGMMKIETGNQVQKGVVGGARDREVGNRGNTFWQ